MPLAKLADLKTRLEIEGSGEDALLTSLLTGVSLAIERHCRRKLLYPAADVTELHDGGVQTLYVEYWPVTSVGSVKESAYYDFDGATALTADSEFRAVVKRGQFVRLPIGAEWLPGRETVQLVYRGGYVDPDDEEVPGVDFVPAHIQEAALLQAAYLWDRRKELGATNVSMAGAGGAVSRAAAYKLLGTVMDMLVGERRVV